MIDHTDAIKCTVSIQSILALVFRIAETAERDSKIWIPKVNQNHHVKKSHEEDDLIELAKRSPKVHNLSIEEQLKPTLDWLQERLGLMRSWENWFDASDEILSKLVQRRPAVLWRWREEHGTKACMAQRAAWHGEQYSSSLYCNAWLLLFESKRTMHHALRN
jgi:hypothetical protein